MTDPERGAPEAGAPDTHVPGPTPRDGTRAGTTPDAVSQGRAPRDAAPSGAADEEDLPGPDWAWRRRLRRNRPLYSAYRIVVFVVGLVVVLGGLALVPLPGPGWALVILGLVIWASEFEKARAVLEFVKRQVRRWNDWMMAQPIWVRIVVGLLTAAFVGFVVWCVLKVGGIPGFVPDGATGWLHTHLWL